MNRFGITIERQEQVEGHTPKQSRKRILDHLCTILQDVDRMKIEKQID